ncbi:MAG: hypothetical protein KC425_04360, partial [Anaerolineales bacterium]|nr:hypothetical protein [Anaerolineales bacterium]
MLKSDPSSALSPSWRSRIAAELQPARLLPALTMGTITGLMEIVLSVSFAALIFSGSLAPFVADGIGLALLGAAVSGTLVALLSSQPGILGGNQDTPAAILVVMATAMAHTLPPESTLVTVLATIALTTLLTGLFQVALGYFKLGSLVRFLPYPVVGGFLAGTGWLLATGAINLMVDFDPLAQPAALFQADVLLRWVPGLLFAGLLL